MKKSILLSIFLVGFFANSQILYKNKVSNTIFKNNTGSLMFKENSSIIPDVPTCIDGIQNGDETGVDCGGSCTPCSSSNPDNGIQDDFESCIPLTTTPVSAVTLSQLTTMTNTRFVIDGNINASNATIGSGNTIESGSGLLTGTNINLNGACIVDDFSQIFASSVTFTSIYDNSRLSPEAFGALGNGSTADDSALSGLIRNVEYATADPTSIYVKNDETVHDRAGIFDWDMNGSIVRTTSAAGLSHGSGVQNQNTYLFEFDGLIPRIRNGEFDGQDLASRAIKVYFSSSFEYENLNVHNYLSPANAYARGVGLKFDLNGSNFTGGSVTNCDIENIGAITDGNANNSPYGVSKALYFEIYDNGATAATINFSGNNINNVYGDDAEGFLSVKGFGGSYNYQTNNIYFVMDGETYTACQRRAFKVNASNITVTNSNITSVTNSPVFPGAQATLVHFFSITNGQPIQNINFSNNTITKVQNAENVFMGVNDAKDVLINGNTFNSTGDLDLYDFVAFGVDATQNGLYSGDLENVVFTNNQMNNVGIQILPNVLAPTGTGLTIEDNDMDFNISSFANGHSGAILIYDLNGATTANAVTIKNLNIDVNMQIFGSSLWAVVKARQSNVFNLTLDNVDVTYTGSSPSYGFGHFISNFDSSNTVINCNLTGVSGTGAITVDGATQNAVITNSTGDGNTPITTQ